MTSSAVRTNHDRAFLRAACARSSPAASHKAPFFPLITIWKKPFHYQMKHIVKIVALLVAMSAIWIGLVKTSVIPHSYTWLLPVYLVVALGCYGLLMVGIGLMFFPTCPQEAELLQKDIFEAKEFLKEKGVDIGSD